MNIIFDLDGTLIDSSKGILSAMKMAFDQCEVSPTKPLTDQLIGPPLDKLLPILADTNDPDIISPLMTAFKEKYDNNGYKATTVFDGVDNMLIQLKEHNHTLYLATNKRIIPTRKIVEYFGWNEFFDDVYALDLFTHTENKTELIAHVVQTHQLDKSRTLYIGDTIADSLATEANQLSYIMALWGYDSASFIDGMKASTPNAIVKYINQF